MVLDPTSHESADVKPMIQVYARKKALAGAASVLMMGTERLRNCQAELARTRSTPDFHIELLRLRQNWRLKKVSNSIIGDLSYRTGLFYYIFIYLKYALYVLYFIVLPLIFLFTNKSYLCYLLAGSKYTQTGMFEVTKAEEEEKSNNSPPASPNTGSSMSGQSHGPSNSKASALRVTIPSELQGVAYIEVLCQKGNIN